jgi:hypothetical protein
MNGIFKKKNKHQIMCQLEEAPDNVPAGVARELVIPQREQVMRWIGIDEQKARRVAAQIGERICDFAEFSHSM